MIKYKNSVPAKNSILISPHRNSKHLISFATPTSTPLADWHLSNLISYPSKIHEADTVYPYLGLLGIPSHLSLGWSAEGTSKLPVDGWSLFS